MQIQQIYHGTPGQHISQAAADACELALARAKVITLDFNDVQIPVHPGQSPDSVVADWRRDMDAAAETYRISPAGQQAKADADARLAKAQSGHDAAMATLPAAFPDARAAVLWLVPFSDAADHVGIAGREFDRVADVLEGSGWKQDDACGLPSEAYEEEGILGRWIIGQAIDMLKKGMPPHPMLMDKFAAKFLTLTA